MPDIFDISAAVCLVLGSISLWAGKERHATAAALYALATFNIVAKIALAVAP